MYIFLARGEDHLMLCLVVWCNYPHIRQALPASHSCYVRRGSWPGPPPRVPTISQETSMATSVPGGYYVNMGN